MATLWSPSAILARLAENRWVFEGTLALGSNWRPPEPHSLFGVFCRVLLSADQCRKCVLCWYLGQVVLQVSISPFRPVWLSWHTGGTQKSGVIGRSFGGPPGDRHTFALRIRAAGPTPCAQTPVTQYDDPLTLLVVR